MRITIKVDGWVYRLPEETAFVEFSSSHDRWYSGSAVAFDAQGQPLAREYVGLEPEEHWTKRVRTERT